MTRYLNHLGRVGGKLTKGMQNLNSSDIAAVNTISTHVQTVSSISTSVTTVDSQSTQVTAVDGVSANVTTVAGISANVTTVAGISSNVTTVAGISGDVTSVATQSFKYLFDTSTSMADPGSGDIRYNHASPASVTAIAVSNTFSGGSDISPFIVTWDDSTQSLTRGSIVIHDSTLAGNVQIFDIDAAITDNGSWLQIPVAHVSGTTLPGSGDALFVSWARTGDAGVSAESGIQMLFEDATTDTDQGAGKVWFDNGTIGSASVFYVDDVDNAAGTSINSQVDTWDDSSNKALRGTITVSKQSNAAIFATFTVKGDVVSASTYSKIPITPITNSGSFTDGDVVNVHFTRTGDRGASGIDMLYESATTDTDQGAGKCWMNNSVGSQTLFYMDDVDNAAGTSINSQVDSWDDSTNTALRGTITMTKQSDPAVFATFNLTSAVTSASTYSKMTVAHVTNAGSFTDGDPVNIQFVRTGNAGGGLANVVEDSTPQLGGFLDTNDKFISHSQGAAIASVAGDTNIWTNFDGNTVHITGTNAITDFGTPKQAGDSMWVIFDAAASVVDSGTITCAGNTNFQAAANDLALVYALTTSTFLFIPFKNDGTAVTAGAGGGPSKGTAPSTFYRTNSKTQTEDLTISNNSATFSATNATNLLDKGTANGFADDMNVRLTGSDLPNGWLEGTDYFVRDVASSTLKLALTIGGSAVTISDDGSGTNTIFEVINAQAVGPITIKTGNSLTIPSGSRVVIS